MSDCDDEMEDVWIIVQGDSDEEESEGLLEPDSSEGAGQARIETEPQGQSLNPIIESVRMTVISTIALRPTVGRGVKSKSKMGISLPREPGTVC